jgi:hypothetical protein
MAGADIGADNPLDVTARTVEAFLYGVQILYTVQGVAPMTTRFVGHGPRRVVVTPLTDDQETGDLHLRRRPSAPDVPDESGRSPCPPHSSTT